MTKDFPVEVCNLAETHALGKPIRVYETDFKSEVKSFLIMGAFLMLFVFSMVLCITGFSFTSKNLLFDEILLGCTLISIFIGGGLTLILRILVRNAHGRNARVYVCAGGLIYQRECSTDVICWEQIERIQTSKSLCTIQHKDGTYKYLYNFYGLGKDLKRRRKKWSQENRSHAHIDDASQEK